MAPFLPFLVPFWHALPSFHCSFFIVRLLSFLSSTRDGLSSVTQAGRIIPKDGKRAKQKDGMGGGGVRKDVEHCR
jgi:hypothetical protein